MVAIECRDDAHERPQAESQANDAGEQAMLAEPCATAPPSTETATGIGAAPARYAPAAGKNVLYMHHEVLVRKPALALLASEPVFERVCGRVDLSRRRPQRLDERPSTRLLRRRWLEHEPRQRSLQ
jgi:hypothetical protein